MHNPRLASQANRIMEAAVLIDGAVAEGKPADRALANYFTRHRHLGSRDRRVIGDVLFSYFRWKGWVRRGHEDDLAPALLAAHALDSDTWHPAMEQWASHVWPEENGPAPIGALPLSEKAACLANWWALAEPPPTTALVPEWVPGAVGHRAAELIASFQERPPTWLRCMPGDRDRVQSYLHENGLPAQPHPRLPDALRVDAAVSRACLNAPQAPPFTIQDLASQCVSTIADPKPNERWLDLCAGAGGKALHLAALLNQTGRVDAHDMRPSALRELAQRAARCGMSGTISIKPEWPDPSDALYDGVLLDAPCSGLGTWSRNADARWRTHRNQVVTSAESQTRLLHEAAQRVRPGGSLVYAVCTVTLAETLEQIDRFERQRPDFSPVPFAHPLTKETPQGHGFIYPWDGPCGAMFVAKWRRTDPAA